MNILQIEPMCELKCSIVLMYIHVYVYICFTLQMCSVYSRNALVHSIECNSYCEKRTLENNMMRKQLLKTCHQSVDKIGWTQMHHFGYIYIVNKISFAQKMITSSIHMKFTLFTSHNCQWSSGCNKILFLLQFSIAISL